MTQIKLTGIITSILFKNQENFYHVLKVEDDKNEEQTIVITQPGIFECITYEFTGEFIDHSKFGKQFKATNAIEIVPTTLDGIKMYLQSGIFPGIGKTIAQRVVDYFGDQTLKVFNETPEKLVDVKGISRKKLVLIQKVWEDNKALNNLIIFLRGLGISQLFAGKIYKFYGKDCIAQIKQNPYKLIDDLEGIGFKMADNIALKSGFAPGSSERLKSAVNYVLKSGTKNGHCYLTKDQIVNDTNDLLSIEVNDRIEIMLQSMVDSKDIKSEIVGDGIIGYYNRFIYSAEVYVSEKIHLFKQQKEKIEIQDEWLNEGTIQLSEEQKSAVKGIICGEGNISVLTGGAGVGKTASLKRIVDILHDKLHKKVVLASPTGRASQRMVEAIGFESSTIHRLLKWDPVNKKFAFNEMNQLEGDFFIIDESSMIDIYLAADLLKAIPEKAKILFCGDPNQLESVAAGSFFKDMIQSEVVPVYRLTKIFRQANESFIIKHAHEINNGIIPEIENPLINHEAWDKKIDCLFIESGLKDDSKNKLSYPKASSLRYGMDIKEMILKLYTETIPKYFGADKEIQILIPQNIGNLGAQSINKLVQDTVNPKMTGKPELTIGERVFRLGDKVIQLKNNYDLDSGVFNGEIGRITSMDAEQFSLTIKFSEDRIIDYKKDDCLDLGLAYAISIHKSQGSEFDCVILPLTMQHFRMMQRRLAYTAATRGRKLVVFVGEKKALAIAVNNATVQNRQTFLKERLMQETFVSPF